MPRDAAAKGRIGDAFGEFTARPGGRIDPAAGPARAEPRQLQPEVPPQVLHLRQVPLRTSV